MPRGDKTGPMGMGSMTGRAAGRCAGHAVAGHMSAGHGGGQGRGRGRGGGGGRDWRNRCCAPGFVAAEALTEAPEALTKEQELAILKGQAEQLEETLEGIRGRLDELKAKPSGKK